MKYSKTIFISLFILIGFFGHSQKEANIWYFGENAGLDFNSGSPVALTDGQLHTSEGCATISDENGSLLFYTDGGIVYNKNHQIMSNGTGLLGNYSSTQSAIIVPKPGLDGIYYIFTVDAVAGSSGLNYSEVDMNLSGGLGAVNNAKKNIQLLVPTCEKITAVRHDNNEDIWVIAHGYNNDNFYAYLVTQNGVNVIPVISASGTVISGTLSTLGYLKASPDGKRLALAHWHYNEVQVFDFDDLSGTVSNPVTVGNNYNGGGPYGVEFSPSGNLLYIGSCSSQDNIYQYDLTATNIASTKTNVATLHSGVMTGALQLAPDGKIYVATTGTDYLSVINYPDGIGVNCDFVLDQLYLGGKKSRLGLPAFVQSFLLKAEFEADFLCLGQESLFVCTDEGVSYVEWSFGDPATGALNQASGNNVMHVFSSPGIFTVSMTSIKNGLINIFEKEITIYDSPEINIDDRVYLCEQISVTLDAYNEDATYKWSNESTESYLEVSTAGTYSVSVTNQEGCVTSKDIDVYNGCGENVIYLPSAFSPNGDGINDMLYVRGTQVEALNLAIYNRFGELVFESDNLDNGWDGQYKGARISNEVFIANLQVTFSDGEEKHIYDNVTMIR